MLFITSKLKRKLVGGSFKMIYKTPEQRKRQCLLDDISLIIVHANSTHDPNEVSKKPIQDLIDKDFADYIYEFVAFHDSFVRHKGVIIDNNKCPGDYHIDDLVGDNYIIVGGGLGNCHLGVYLALLSARFTRKTKVHLPVDSIYKTYEDYEGGNIFLSSELVDLKNEGFRRYEGLIKDIRNNSNYEIIDDSNVVDSSKDKSIWSLMLWSSKDAMLCYLQAQKR